MTPNELAALAAATLGPALPYFVAAGTEAAKELGKKTAAGVTEGAQKIWNWLQPHAEQHPALRDAVQEVATRPEDQDAQGALRLQIRKLLEAQPKLAQELGAVVRNISVEGKGNIVAGGDINAGNITITNT
jgi:hypothetical protein